MRAIDVDDDRSALGTTHDGAGDVEAGRQLVLARDDELRRELEPLADPLGPLTQRVDGLGGDGRLLRFSGSVASSAIST